MLLVPPVFRLIWEVPLVPNWGPMESVPPSASMTKLPTFGIATVLVTPPARLVMVMLPFDTLLKPAADTEPLTPLLLAVPIVRGVVLVL